MRIRSILLHRLCGVVFVFFVLIGCNPEEPYERPMVDTTDTRSKPIVALAEELPQLGRFVRALDLTGYRELLDEPGPFTVFAPVDEGFLRAIRMDSAFAAAPRDTLRSIIQLHVVRGSLERIWTDSMTVSTLANQPVTLRRSTQGLTIQDKPILGRFVARNGMLYVIPSPIVPPPPDTTRGLLERRRVPLRT